VSSLHWLVLFPYYFFTALTLFLAFSIVCRLTGIRISANPLATGAIVTGLIATALPLVSGYAQLGGYSWPPLVILLVVSLVLATVDTFLKSSLPLPLDEELEDV